MTVRLSGIGPFSTPVPTFPASSMTCLISALYIHSTCQSSIRSCALSAISLASSISSLVLSMISCSISAPFCGLAITSGSLAIADRMSLGISPSAIDTNSGIGVGLIAHPRSSVGSNISLILAAAASQYGRVMLKNTVLPVLVSASPRAA